LLKDKKIESKFKIDFQSGKTIAAEEKSQNYMV